MDFVQGGVIRLLSVPRAIWLKPVIPGEITDNIYSGLKDKLYGYPSHRLLQQSVTITCLVREAKTQERKDLPSLSHSDGVEMGIETFCRRRPAWCPSQTEVFLSSSQKASRRKWQAVNNDDGNEDGDNDNLLNTSYVPGTANQCWYFKCIISFDLHENLGSFYKQGTKIESS